MSIWLGIVSSLRDSDHFHHLTRHFRAGLRLFVPAELVHYNWLGDRAQKRASDLPGAVRMT